MNSYGQSGRPNDTEALKIVKGDGNIPDLLYDLLVRATPHGLEGNVKAILPFFKDGIEDEIGNLIVRIGENPKTMFSSHLDTVHDVEEAYIKKKADVRFNLITASAEALPKEQGFIWGGLKNPKKEKDSDPNWLGVQLGADDKTGVYIMSKLIEKGTPGLYIFHVGEEKGCIGSKFLVKKTPEVVKGIKRCIAFDRAGYTDISSHQVAGRCASDRFTEDLADQLNKKIGSVGTQFRYNGRIHTAITDSMYYRDLVPECTNISVGYFNQHGYEEKQDFQWLLKHFMPAVLEVNWEELSTIRNPNEKEVYHTYNSRLTSSYRTKVKPAHATRHTPDDMLPDWKPSDGLYYEATYDGMNEIMRKWARITNHRDIADALHAIMISRDLLKMKLDGLELNDEIPDLAPSLPLDQGVKTTVMGPKKEEAVVMPLVLPPPKATGTASSIQTRTQYDELGFPKSKSILEQNTKTKIIIIGQIVSNKFHLKLKGKPADEFAHLEMKFNKLNKNLMRGKASIGRNAYRTLNEMLTTAIKLIGDSENASSSVFVEAFMEGEKYIQDHWFEPGILISGKQ